MEKSPKDNFLPFEYQIPTPEKAAANYLYPNTKSNIVPSLPIIWDTPPRAPYVQLTEVQKKFVEVEDEAIQKSITFEEKRKNLEEQWKKLAEEEEAFQTTFLDFNNFVSLTTEKIERSKQKILNDREAREKLITDIKNLKIKYDKLLTTKEMMKKQINDYAIYENYLQDVVSETEEFKSINNIIMKYESYMTAKFEIFTQQEKDYCNLETAKSKMARFVEQNYLIIMGLQTHISKIQSRYTTAKDNSIKMEFILDNIQKKASKKMNDIQFSKVCIWHIYKLMCHKKNIEPQYSQNNTELQLAFIKQNLKQLQRVNKILKKGKLYDESGNEQQNK